ncbi:hypothetical protein COY26_03395 [Candidatus Woesearchaeota archaeon CG_4_10_14_0_2_um_filter_33_10]|nr:MAG: hypothetical protein COS79_04480 [Candidatus Woesearchaeota archaeon CG06_land_8_20_14_3_00_33_13]PIZ52860.1 MAG: hypothetical protein COY26_03395 [Candidatus Woesearchaeota archaeon CG_4_10_14_0_2_um_filter_33_10]
MKDPKVIEQGKLSLKVDSKVVSHLSIGLYKNFSRAIKELVSNAYDALATEVKINLDLKSKRLIIKDNGKGMNKTDIENNLLTIGKTTPRTAGIVGLGRKRIGQFGVGFLAVFPYCKSIYIISKKEGETNAIELTIEVYKYYQDNSWTLNNNLQDIDYKIRPSLLPKDKGETIIALEKIEDHIINQLQKNKKEGLSSIEQFGGFEKTKWELQQYLPLQYPKSHTELKEFFEDKKRTPIRVWFDGEELHRNIPEGTNNKKSEIIEKGEETFGNIKIKYAIISPFTSIRPQEARGFQIRLNDVGIGMPSDFDVIKLKGRVLGKLNYLSGEVHILEGLDNDIMLDRDGFYFTEDVSKMHAFLRDKMTKWDSKFQETAKDDKQVYETIARLPQQDKIVQEFKSAGILKFDKANLRIQKAPITQKKKTELSSISKRMDSILTKKGFTIEKKKQSSDKKSLIDVDTKTKKVTIYEDNPALTEHIDIDSNSYQIKYVKKAELEKKNDLCDIDYKKNIASFNKEHEIFKIGLDNKVIIEFIIRLHLIAKDDGISQSFVNKVTKAFEKTFSR